LPSKTECLPEQFSEIGKPYANVGTLPVVAWRFSLSSRRSLCFFGRKRSEGEGRFVGLGQPEQKVGLLYWFPFTGMKERQLLRMRGYFHLTVPEGGLHRC
jgi:hypothetical protein